MTDTIDKADKVDKVIDKVIDKTYVATPPELIDFVAYSIKYVMKEEFGKELDDKDVQILSLIHI